MDKYTVDLDKVLNDFEYTELTDHQGENKHIKNSPKNEPKIIASSSSVKHPMNNVFHSLNEYINTEISQKCHLDYLTGTLLNAADSASKVVSESSSKSSTVTKESAEPQATASDQDADSNVEANHQVASENGETSTEKTSERRGSDLPEEILSSLENYVEGTYSVGTICFDVTPDITNVSHEYVHDVQSNTNETNVFEGSSTETNAHTIEDYQVNATLDNTSDVSNENVNLETKEITTEHHYFENPTVIKNIAGSADPDDNKHISSSEPADVYNMSAEINKNVVCEVNTAEMLVPADDILPVNQINRESGDCANYFVEQQNINNAKGVLVQDNNKRSSLELMEPETVTIELLTGDNNVNEEINCDEKKTDSYSDSFSVEKESEKADEVESVNAVQEYINALSKSTENYIMDDTVKSNSMEEHVKSENIVKEISVENNLKTETMILNNTLQNQVQSENTVIATQVLNKTRVVKNTNESNVNEAKQEQKLCCFDDSLVNMDDTELNKYLEELEQEYESQYKDLEEGSVERQEPIDNVKHIENTDNQNEGNAIIEDTCQSIVENPSEEVLAKVQDDITQSEERSSITSVKINVVETDLSCDNLNDEKEEILEIILENVPADESRELQDSMEKAQTRPSSLEVTSCLTEHRKSIDLVGEPGSTPYNNVYIVEELPNVKLQEQQQETEQVTTKPPEPDSENSSCTSPTFSNASTETISSSTDSSDLLEDARTPVVDTHGLTSRPEVQASGDVGGSTRSTQEEGTRLESSSQDAAVDEVSSDEPASVETAGEANESTAAASGVSSSAGGDCDTQVRTDGGTSLGKEAPIWVPDSDALNCMLCDMKFTVIKRRHHCRACGMVICSKCSNYKYRLEYLDAEARVCVKCYDTLEREFSTSSFSDSSSDMQRRPPPNPNNPLEYCSTLPPHQQIQGTSGPPAVLVPVGVLKRKGSNKMRTNKSVMFCDGIRPGSDLTNLDNDFNYNESKNTNKKAEAAGGSPKVNKNCPLLDSETKSFIPKGENNLPPTVAIHKTDITYSDCANNPNVVEMLKNEPLVFAIQKNLHVHVKIINMNCCINKTAWCFSTEGLINVGQDEVVIILEYIEEEAMVPKDIFAHINLIYSEAVKGSSVKELGLSLHNTSNFLDSKNHAGFVFIKPSFQCLEKVIKPKETYLIGILIHRWETPWAKLFPLRLILRLGAEYRYYPSPIISTRHRDSVFVEVGHTIINLLADFRNYSYTLPQIRGLTIHMEGKNTTVTIPSNRYDQVMKSMNNSSDHILAFAGNFSQQADSHLVCIQDTQSNDNAYSTHSINIHNKPRKVTGASFIVFNGALKSSSGLTAKSSIVEDGLMIQILPEHMTQVRDSLRNMKNHVIRCGCINADTDETVSIIWGESDLNFNIGVMSPIDGQPMAGVPSIRVHNGKDFVANSGNRLIRWTEVFILQNTDETSRNQDPVDISKVSESIAKATCQALVKYLDLLVSNNFCKIGIRTTLHVENVSYAAGGNGVKLPPIYMKSLDNELIPVLHRITSNNLGENIIVLELIFRVLNI